MQGKRLVLISLAATICFAVIGPSLRAQATKPGPENKKLEVFLGSWTFEWDTKASVFGPAGRITGVERYESMPGGFFVQMNREAKGPQGDFRDHFVFGYDPVAKKHTLTIFGLADGTSGSYTGTANGNIWAWSGSGHTGSGKSYQERCTVTVAAGGASFALKCEATGDGKTWSPSIDGKYTKSR